jgi:hypothetical protein
MTTSMKAQCCPRPRGILGSRLCQEGPLENAFDFIDAKCWGVNEQLIVMIYIIKRSQNKK